MHGAPGAHRARGRRSTPAHAPGRRRGGRHDRQAVGLRRGRRRRPAAPGVQEQADVGGDVVAQEGDLQQDDRGEDQDREQPGADPPSRIPLAAGGARRRVRTERGGRATRWPGIVCLPRVPADRLRQRGELGADGPAVDPGRASPSVRATAGTPATGSSATARSSSASSGPAAGSGRRARNRAARAMSSSSAPTATPDGRSAEAAPPSQRSGSGRRTTTPSAPMTTRSTITWSHSAPCPDRPATAASRPAPTSTACAGVSPARRAGGSARRRPQPAASDRPADGKRHADVGYRPAPGPSPDPQVRHRPPPPSDRP